MKRILPQLAVAQIVVACSALVMLGSLGSGEVACAAPQGGEHGVKGAAGSTPNARLVSLAGVVRDAEGTAQIGVIVELLRGNRTLAARVFTNQQGGYSIASVLPGEYALKATGASFIPVMKRNLRIRANTVVNLTLNNLYDLMQWSALPQRVRTASEDDWAWTLRSAESRPLLRWQEDGSPILVSDASEERDARLAETRRGGNARRRMRVLGTGGQARFGSGSQQISMGMEENASPLRRVAMSANQSPDAIGVMDAMLGFRQEMASSGWGSRSVQTLAAVMIDRDAGAGPQQGLTAVSLRTWESLQLLDNLEAEAGSNQVLARVGDGSGAGSAIFAALPFASVTLHRGQSALEYRVETARDADPEASELTPGRWLPILSERAVGQAAEGEQTGRLVLEHGLHQELGWSTSAGPAEMRLVIFADNVENPMLEASTSAGRDNASHDMAGLMLVDRASGLLRGAGPSYSTTGMLATVESRLPGHNRVRLSYASGDALVMHAVARPESVQAILQGAHAHRAQMYSVMLSGTADGTGTRWRASYRWQPDATVTEIAPFALDASEPYLNISIRQPIKTNRPGVGGMEAQLDLRNLLAEGYQPFVTSDGARLYFAQAQRCVRGGLAFNF